MLLAIVVYHGMANKGWPEEHLVGPAHYIASLSEYEARRAIVVVLSADGSKVIHQPVEAAAKALDRDIAERGPTA